MFNGHFYLLQVWTILAYGCSLGQFNFLVITYIDICLYTLVQRIIEICEINPAMKLISFQLYQCSLKFFKQQFHSGLKCFQHNEETSLNEIIFQQHFYFILRFPNVKVMIQNCNPIYILDDYQVWVQTSLNNEENLIFFTSAGLSTEEIDFEKIM